MTRWYRALSLLLLVALSLLLVARAASAGEVPAGSPYDARIQYVTYNAGDVVIVSAPSGRAVRIVFAPGETIRDVASGFSEGWEFLDRGNILYLKARSLEGEGGTFLSPKADKWNTNLLVATDKRLYDFELRLSGGDAVAYRVEFRYPEDELATAKEKEALALAAAKKKEGLEKLAGKPAPVNSAYSMQIGKRSKRIVPAMAYDDGNFTYLKFPANRDFPAVFLVAEDKSESLVNSHVEGEVLVVHRVAPELRLRLGRAVVGVYNEAFDPDGAAPKDGTTAPGVKRELKGGK
jgi:P-type conjugative transfer protein VirB9